MQAIRKPTAIASLLLLVAAVLLSACGNGNSAGTGASASPANSPSASPSSTPSASTSPSPSAEGEATRIVSTVNGDVEIPAHPKRIVALYYHHILFALGEKPVGANLTWWGGSPFLAEQEAGLVDIGGPPSLEAVAALEPDLIIMNSNNAEDYEQFAKIAPSVLIPYDGNRTVYQDTVEVAKLLGKPDEATRLLEEFEKKAEAARAKLEGVWTSDAKAAIIRIDGNGGQFTVFGDNYGRGGWPIYRGLKLQYPAKIKEDVIDSGKQIVKEVPLEKLPEYAEDADYLFVSTEGAALDVVKDSAVWKGLKAVKENRVIELEAKQYYYFDPISISAQMDLIADLLPGNSPQ
ncbi:ABC transporter substrate-binding protein [Cohnella sp.]|uniref:ABC transporter substrate-binding protein n=1 Tax=Cohnella sp. TaxID=1883426 RepID=UPI00356230BA